MTKRIAILVLTAFTMLIPLLDVAPKASADNISVGYVLDSDPGAHLSDSEWCNAQGKHLSWPTAVSTCNTGGGTTTFDKANSSYAMFRSYPTQINNPDYTPTNGKPQYLKTNRFVMYVASTGHKITFYKGPDANGNQQYYLTSDAFISVVNIVAEPNSDPDFKYNWTGSYSLDQYSTGVTSGINPADIPNFRGVVIGNDQFVAQVGAVNVNYASSWDMGHFTNNVPYGEDGAANCGTLDIGCWVGKLTSGFTNGIKALFGLMVDAFKWLFIPDGTQIKSSFDDLTTFMNNKLGFLAYPFTFIGNVFNAFTSGSSWCNDTGCSKNFGNLFGHPFNVNLGQMQTTMPSIWFWFTGMIRGLTILTLLLAVRQKYRAVTSK